MELQPREIGEDEYLSQYVTREAGQPRLRNRPRLRDIDGLSLTAGKLTPAEARKPVRRGSPTEDDGVRHVRTGDLRAEGFIVENTPSRRNTEHVSIRYPREWDDQVASTFNGCCSDPVWHQEPGRRLR